MPVMTVGTGRALIPTGIKYNDKVLATGPIAYWPQSETAGVTAHCLVNPLQDGTYTGVTLANDNTGPFGTGAPYYDGTNDYCTILSAALTAAFDGDEASTMCWLKPFNLGVWTDGAQREPLRLLADANNYLLQYKSAVNNTLEYAYRSGGIIKGASYAGQVDIGWQQWIVTCSDSGDAMRFYQNAVQPGPVQTVFGPWAGGLTVALMGAGSAVPQWPWHGWLGPCAIWNRALPQETITALYNC